MEEINLHGTKEKEVNIGVDENVLGIVYEEEVLQGGVV